VSSHNSPANRSAYLALAAAIAIGSVSFTLVRLVLQELSALSVSAGRVVVSAITFSIVVLRSPARRTPILPGHRLRVFACGFGGSVVFHVLFNWGQLKVSVAIAAVIMSTYPVLTTVGEVVFLHHRLRRVQVVGVCLATVGCIAIGVTGGLTGSSSMWGALAILLAALVWAAVTVITRDIGDRYDSWWLNTPGTLAGALCMLVIAAPNLHEFGDLSLRGWLLVIWLGSASSAFIYYAMAKAMTVMSATTTTSITTVVTPASVVVAWVVLGDAPSLAEVLGGIVVITGVMLVVHRSVTPEPVERELVATTPG
jgi:drug/metabolite transporter, DME family